MNDTDQLREVPPPCPDSRKPDPVEVYREQLREALARGDATEHTHRRALQWLLEAVEPEIVAVNEPRRAACGARTT